MARIRIRKVGPNLRNVVVQRSLPGERNAERATVCDVKDLEEVVRGKLARIKVSRPVRLPGT